MLDGGRYRGLGIALAAVVLVCTAFEIICAAVFAPLDDTVMSGWVDG
ncbi:hypothetical protein ACFYZN_25310 [Streptomyces sp. NPDC001777]